jgi:transcriptional regulator with XRE-family HTH domain
MMVGLRIKQRRKEMGISADELGKKIGKNRATVFRYENGDIEKLPIDILKPIAEALSTTPQALMGWEEVQNKNDALADIVLRLRTDDELLAVVQAVCNLDKEKLSSLATFLK